MQEEKFANRDLTYSAWHRRLSTRRFIGINQAQLLAMIDVDATLWVEYDPQDKEPLALVETARDTGQEYKSMTVMSRLALRSRLPCFCVLYQPSTRPNPADHRFADIDGFRIKRIWPNPQTQWRELTPREWAEALLRLREWCARQLDVEAANDRVFDAGHRK